MISIDVFVAIAIAVPVVFLLALGVDEFRRRRRYKKRNLSAGSGGEQSPLRLEDVKTLPLKKKAAFLLAAIKAGLFLMHKLNNHAEDYDAREQLQAYRDYMGKPYNVDAVKALSKEGYPHE